jgi:hypothetical protein
MRRMPNAIQRAAAGTNRRHAAQCFIHRKISAIDLDGRANERGKAIDLVLATS